VEPGDQLLLQATLERNLKGIWKLATLATVDGAEAAAADMMLAPDLAGATPAGKNP
jgi:3-hydroxyacyl-[acyl-carrier-protein] dehydratase